MPHSFLALFFAFLWTPFDKGVSIVVFRTIRISCLLCARFQIPCRVPRFRDLAAPTMLLLTSSIPNHIFIVQLFQNPFLSAREPPSAIHSSSPRSLLRFPFIRREQQTHPLPEAGDLPRPRVLPHNWRLPGGIAPN
jgi:hypothetical protein